MAPKSILIADSGSTKTAWCLLRPGQVDATCHTAGINPVLQGTDEVLSVLRGELLPQLAEQGAVGEAAPQRIVFYGAGCLPARIPLVAEALQALFPHAVVAVGSDLLGAARALCGHNEGMACILGTGSNSCLFDGAGIVANVSPLGYVLGDEGSGAVLGRCLVGDVLKGILPQPLREDFFDTYRLTADDIIERVYRRPMPNRFLASLAPFLARHRQEEPVRRLLTDNFGRFFRRNVAAYARPELPVHFTGSIAFFFSDELREAAHTEGFVVGRIEREPLLRLADFHRAD